MLQGYPGGRYCEDVPSSNETPSDDSNAPVPEEQPRALRIAYVAGVTPGKWIRRWEERMPHIPLSAYMHDGGAQVAPVRDGSADMAFIRLPVDRDGLSVIPLYEEQPVVVAPKGHEISVFEEVALEDLEQESFLDVPALGGPEPALQVVAAGSGLAVLPMSVARHFNVKDTVARRLNGAPGTEIALVWLTESTDEVLEEFIGIVRGRTVNSTRTPRQDRAPAPSANAPKKSMPRRPARRRGARGR